MSIRLVKTPFSSPSSSPSFSSATSRDAGIFNSIDHNLSARSSAPKTAAAFRQVTARPRGPRPGAIPSSACAQGDGVPAVGSRPSIPRRPLYLRGRTSPYAHALAPKGSGSRNTRVMSLRSGAPGFNAVHEEDESECESEETMNRNQNRYIHHQTYDPRTHRPLPDVVLPVTFYKPLPYAASYNASDPNAFAKQVAGLLLSRVLDGRSSPRSKENRSYVKSSLSRVAVSI
ncbi:uncharacterized protein BT62DRAFT_363597 [Guyanagaster necrorhizus]|uniref:Uncharacterized protein n=1 Tax=Guyanagaster necrorhizus TaxID=856835 RepID=A0A9P8APK9_9AGAR|nr:uncharacterized protein BT62DRAFT_363597 [Guyanagaster necrorhizus MCA 3950]KAG7442911.1 hypothetical protein BT62DRAFT_363597 [Guyanagaster necrorhizus MCA 3950]